MGFLPKAAQQPLSLNLANCLEDASEEPKYTSFQLLWTLSLVLQTQLPVRGRRVPGPGAAHTRPGPAPPRGRSEGLRASDPRCHSCGPQGLGARRRGAVSPASKLPGRPEPLEEGSSPRAGSGVERPGQPRGRRGPRLRGELEGLPGGGGPGSGEAPHQLEGARVRGERRLRGCGVGSLCRGGAGAALGREPLVSDLRRGTRAPRGRGAGPSLTGGARRSGP